MPSSSAVEIVRARPALGTIVTVRASGGTGVDVRGSIDRAFGRIAEIEHAMSFHRATSEISRLNRSRPGVSVRVSDDTYSVLALAHRMFAVSGGLFDPAIATTLEQNGLLPTTMRSKPTSGSFADVELLPRRHVRLRRALRIDIGGIAKGYAVDAAVEMLRSEGVQTGSVNAGGDLRVFGPLPQTIHVRHPQQCAVLIPLLAIRDGAVATTATYFSRCRRGKRLVSPLVHPSTRRTVTRRTSVSVIAPTCAVADALTKVVYFAGGAAAPLIRQFGASAAIVSASGVRLVNDHAA